MSLLFADDTIEIAWPSAYQEHYLALGYASRRHGELFSVKPEHLPANSNRRVRVICPDCGAVREVTYYAAVAKQSTRCAKCAQFARSKDLTGQRFGRWVAVERSKKYSDGCYGWLCRCDCGTESIVPTSNLTQGHSLSCGCLHVDNISGANHYRYNPNLTDLDRESRRDLSANLTWRFDVKKAHGFKCETCGYNKGKRLVAHHLNSWADYPDQRYELSNGVCLCSDCHKRFHAIYGYGGNTRDQFIEFIAHDQC